MDNEIQIKDKFIHKFNDSVEHISLPKSFTYPFFYEPHPLAIAAALDLQKYLETQNDFSHDFGFSNDFKSGIGKMFGVLVVKDANDNLGFLAAFSGKLANSNKHEYFVPPIFDLLDENGFYLKIEEELNQMNREIELRLESVTYSNFKNNLKIEEQKVAEALIELKKEHKINKKKRDQIRENLISEELQTQLKNQSIADSYELKQFKREAALKIQGLQDLLNDFELETERLKDLRKRKSNKLQSKIFEHYSMLNARGERKDLMDIFDAFNGDIPPSGSGECAAPKLLNYAYSNNLQPICMAEFWWGRPALSKVRKHGLFYPACRSKCEPIMSHMLIGLNVEANPIVKNYGTGKDIQIIHEDDDILIVNKPEGLLSVPGKSIEDSVYSRLKNSFPAFPDLLLVHRLDMSTSGIIVVAKHLKAHKFIQRQFIKRRVYKRYVAILDGELSDNNGKVELPMRVDLDNRPRQLVCFEHGKMAITEYQVVKIKNKKTRINFFPKTGRTHQLRLHAAHNLGLATPIIGDDLYGKQKDRLYLHAEEISFIHPSTRDRVRFIAAADF